MTVSVQTGKHSLIVTQYFSRNCWADVNGDHTVSKLHMCLSGYKASAINTVQSFKKRSLVWPLIVRTNLVVQSKGEDRYMVYMCYIMSRCLCVKRPQTHRTLLHLSALFDGTPVTLLWPNHGAQILIHISIAMSVSNEDCGMDATSLVILTLCRRVFWTQLSGQIGFYSWTSVTNYQNDFDINIDFDFARPMVWMLTEKLQSWKKKYWLCFHKGIDKRN